MPRLQAIDPAAATGRAKELLDGVHKKLGATPNLLRAMANQPAVLDAYLKVGEALGQGRFDAKTREAIALTVAGANGCDYCASAHAAISKGLKVGQTEIESHLAGRSDDPKLQALLTFTGAVVAKRGYVTDADLAAVRASGHDDDAIVETVANVAVNILTNYLNHVAETEIDFPLVSPNRAAA